jgi:Flp pilus assembly protein TadG
MKYPRRTGGQSLVEFALIAPLLVMVLFGIVELGILLNVYIGMTNSAREAARAGAIFQYTGSAPMSGDATAAGVIDASRREYLSGVITETLNPIVDSTTVTVTTSYTPTTALATNPYRAGETIAVQLAHDHELFFGILGPKKITISASSAMRIEPGGTR